MTDIDLDAFLAMLPAHSDDCEEFAEYPEGCDCSVTETATALVAEVRRLRDYPPSPSAVMVQAERMRAERDKAEATIAAVRALMTRAESAGEPVADNLRAILDAGGAS